MSDLCEHWIRLSDRAALGGALVEREAAFLQAHAASCELCGAEHETWRALAGLLAQGSELCEDASTGPHAGMSWSVRATIAATAVACAAALVLGLLTRERGHDASSASARSAHGAVPEPSPARIASTTGAFEIDGTPAQTHARLQTGELLFARGGVTCLELEPAVRACLSAGSLLRVVELGQARRVELLRGRIAAELQPQPPGSSFAVLTRDGSALAVGTAFSVELPADGGPSVTRVLHGVVLVRGSSGAGLRVPAHYAASPSGELIALAAKEEAREQTLLTGNEDTRSPTVQRAPANTAPSVNALAPERSAATRRTRADRAATCSDCSPAAAHAPPAAEAPAASDLLLAARDRAAAGDWERALDAYRSLLAQHADSAEAHAACVPLGEILLAHADPAGALAAFERYLARGGPLVQEATFGRVRALRALQRSADEHAAVAELLRRFPDGALAASLRARERELDAKRLRRPIALRAAPSSQNTVEAPQ